MEIKSEQETKKQREELLRLVIEYFKRIDKANKAHLMNLTNSEEALKAIAKSFQDLNKNQDLMKGIEKSAVSTAASSAISTGIIKIAEKVLIEKLGKGAFAASASSKLLPGIGWASAALDIGLFAHEVKDIIDKMNMAQDASKDKFTLEALKVAIDLGDPTAKLIFEELMKEALRKIYGSGSAGRYGEEGGGRLKDPLTVEGALEKFRNDPDLKEKLSVIEDFYSILLSCGLEKTDVMVYQEFFDKIAKTINSTEILGEKVGELGQECDGSTKSLSSLSKLLEEGKLGDLAHLDTSKQNEVFKAPSAELEDYEIEYPERAPEPVKKGNYGIDEKVPFFSGRDNALPDDYNKQYTSKQYEPSAELDDYEIDYPEKAPGSGFFGGLWSSFKSGVDDLKKQFGFGGGKGLLGNLFGGKDTGGGLLGMLGSFGGPQEGILGTMQQFASMIPGIGGMISNIIGGIGTAFNALKSLFGGIGYFIKNINTHLFLFIKYNYLLQQNRYAKKSNVGTGLIPVRSSLQNLCGFQPVIDSFLFEAGENGLKITTQNAYI